MSSRIEQLIDEIEEYIDSCKYQPLSNSKIIVNKEELEELLRELRMKTPDEIKRYQKIINNKEAILNDAREKAEALINEATVHTSELINEHEIMQQAYAHADQVVEQVIRPTGLLDPKVEVRPVTGQIDDLMDEIRARAARDERVLVTTLTKKMAEDLTEYLKNAGIRVRYMHSDVQTIERMEIIRSLRLGEFDVLVGINLLREGLDLPEVSLVAILDADKEGFLRSETSLIQTIGRAARNADGLVIMYADEITPSMRAAIDETERRRSIQDAYNQEHGIVPKTIIKGVREILEISKTAEEDTLRAHKKRKLTEQERAAEIAKLEKEMREASKMLEFEYAAVLRDRIIELRGEK